MPTGSALYSEHVAPSIFNPAEVLTISANSLNSVEPTGAATRLKIMMVDDHAAFRQVLRTMLAPLAADFVECRDGQEAVDQYAATRPDCVLMDIEMKPMDGLSATAQLISRFPTARIIMLTEYDEADLREAARRAGACDYVLKEELPRLHHVIEAQMSQIRDSHSSPGPN